PGQRRQQLRPPPSDHTGTLERQVPLVVQVHLEQSTVLGGRTGHDRADPAGVVAEPRVVPVARVPAVGQRRGDAEGAEVATAGHGGVLITMSMVPGTE